MVIIEVSDFKKYFGKTRAVDGVSFSVEKGEIFGFLGPNGAGKTTTIRCLMDFLRPTSGSIKLFGLDNQDHAVELKHRIGYLSGYVRFYDKWTGWDHIRFFRKFNGQSDSSAELIRRLDFDPTRKTGQLSSGNKQKLGIILALQHNPELLILDEPTIGLDPILQNEIYKIIHERVLSGATVFFSSHNMPEVEKICNRVGIIRQGKMVAVQRIEELKEKKVYRIHAHTDGAFDLSRFQTLNITVLQSLEHELNLEARGDINPIVKELSRYQLKELTIERAPLEQIFLEYYEK
ncbi:MAG: ABC transporter ATP-binding protein [Patescibacteria group bacterium]|nr:ABC transporter ATP-binding protein [Patescibacteria group bacterium]MDD5566703.1 ABC transporter ATP-binding protein [Patescibacteria group bacterium]